MSHITGDTASLWTGVKMVQILKFEVGKGFQCQTVVLLMNKE